MKQSFDTAVTVCKSRMRRSREVMRSFLCSRLKHCKVRYYSSKSSDITNPRRSRTVYIGYLPDAFSLDDILSSHLHNGQSFGALDRIHVLPERNCVFIDFLRIENATKFLNSVARNGLSIDGKVLDVGPASTIATPVDLICAVGLRNATRTLKLSSLDSSWTASSIRTRLQPYGFVEHIHMNRKGAYAFVSFMDIMTACKVSVYILLPYTKHSPCSRLWMLSEQAKQRKVHGQISQFIWQKIDSIPIPIQTCPMQQKGNMVCLYEGPMPTVAHSKQEPSLSIVYLLACCSVIFYQL